MRDERKHDTRRIFDAMGPLSLIVSESGATVRVDDQEVGIIPADILDNVIEHYERAKRMVRAFDLGEATRLAQDIDYQTHVLYNRYRVTSVVRLEESSLWCVNVARKADGHLERITCLEDLEAIGRAEREQDRFNRRGGENEPPYRTPA